MSEFRVLSADVSTDIAAAIDDAVRNGEYSSVGDVVRNALGIWLEEREAERARPDTERRAQSDRLKRLWEEGLASGEPIDGAFDADDIVRRGKARMASRHAA